MLKAEDKEVIHQVGRLLEKAKNVLFITGAGLSADSNLPTYRGVGGLYDETDPVEGIPIEEILSIRTFERDPALTWKYIGNIEQACRGATYNRGHEVIALLEKRLPNVWVMTQNIDGLHQRAGSKNVIDYHGTLYRLYCLACDAHFEVKDFSEMELPPKCKLCGGLIRPDVVLFDEILSKKKAQQVWCLLEDGLDLIFSIGTSSSFYHISMPVVEGKRRGVPCVEINPSASSISHFFDYRIKAKAAETLDALWESISIS